MKIFFFQNTQLRSRIGPVNTMKINIQGILTTQYMVLFQSSFVIFHSTNGTLYKFDCNIYMLYIQKKLHNKLFKELFHKTIRPSVEY